ncbi:MAG: uL22 family ribosomal protein [bacterium]|nr:uL22 family ribosomal protein [bacterium]
MTNIIVAKAKFTRGSARKLRWVADSVRKLPPLEAIAKLQALPHRAAKTLLPVFQQAMGNAKNNFSLSPEKLTIKSVQIGEGPRYKRRDVHAHGARYDSGIRHKKLSHILVELEVK